VHFPGSSRRGAHGTLNVTGAFDCVAFPHERVPLEQDMAVEIVNNTQQYRDRTGGLVYPVKAAVTVLAVLLSGSVCALADDQIPDDQFPVEAEADSGAGIDWSSLLQQSLRFLAIEHGFRWATEEGTRHPHRSFFGGYADSLNGLHGWADGDPFYVNYVGHPMQGAVSGYLFAQNDRRYRTVEFGKDRRYWKSRLRAAAFAWAYSEQF
jgi:hypothetical protein